ncbi:MAG: hypothetical protein ACXWV5_01400, partial [Flavitalea sp.]
VVLHGQTGCGKTRLLNELSARGFPVIDLESLANHRGSAFGQLNIQGHQPTQVQFEKSIETSLEDASYSKLIFLEFESPNLGKLRIPDKIISMFREGVQVLLKTGIHRRVQYILEEYLPADKSLLIKSLEKLKLRIESEEKFIILIDLLESEQYKEFCYHILDYYDNSKNYMQPIVYDYILDEQEISTNADKLLSWMHARYITAGHT